MFRSKKDGTHFPIGKKSGVSEKDLNISQKGNNDTIVVEPSKTKSMEGHRDSDIKEYDRGIKVEGVVLQPVKKLEKNEYYALMVTDEENRGSRPKKDYVDFYKGYIGLERTSDGRIYISKDYEKRSDQYRGKTVVVEVSPDARTTELFRWHWVKNDSRFQGQEKQV